MMEHKNLNEEREACRREVIRNLTASKANAKAFLEKAGIVDKSGNLSKLYR